MAEVSFDAARLVIDPVLLLVLLAELLDDRPGPRPHRRILDGRLVFKRVGAGARPALDQVQILARAAIVVLRAEIGHVDDERVAFPAPARVAEPLADVGRQMRAAIHHDAALPALALAHVVVHRDAARRLHDPPEAAAAVAGAEFRQPDGQAAVRQRALLGAVMAVHARRVVAGRKLVAPRRGCRIVLAAGASGLIELARLRRLHQGQAEFAIGGDDLGGLRRHRRDAAVGRIDDRRRALAGALHGAELVVVGARDVQLAATLAPFVATAILRPDAVELRPLLVSEEFLVRKPGGALERGVIFDRPDPLQVGLAPGGLQARRRLRRRLRADDRHNRANGCRRESECCRGAQEPIAHAGPPCALPAFAVCSYPAKTRFLPGEPKICADGSAVWHEPVGPLQVSGNARPVSDSPNDTVGWTAGSTACGSDGRSPVFWRGSER